MDMNEKIIPGISLGPWENAHESYMTQFLHKQELNLRIAESSVTEAKQSITVAH